MQDVDKKRQAGSEWVMPWVGSISRSVVQIGFLSGGLGICNLFGGLLVGRGHGGRR